MRSHADEAVDPWLSRALRGRFSDVTAGPFPKALLRLLDTPGERGPEGPREHLPD